MEEVDRTEVQMADLDLEVPEVEVMEVLEEDLMVV